MEESSRKALVSALELKRYELGDSTAVNNWYKDSEELATHTRNEKLSLEASDARDKSLMQVLRHLGYSETRLQELWEWRAGEGKLWKAEMKNMGSSTTDKFSRINANTFPFEEAKEFCAGLGITIG